MNAASSVTLTCLRFVQGAVLVNRKLDRERIPSYTFGVAALDNPTADKRRRAIQRITIEVQDVNDNAPVLTHQRYVGQIDETKQPGEKVLNVRPGAVQATDADFGQNANLSFHMSSQGDVQLFRMDSQSGEVFVNTTIEGQAGTYNYTVTVADHGQPSLNASANLTIEIIDKNINTPRFVGNYTNIHVAEVSVYVCVYVCEKERERECVCVCVCVCVQIF